MANSDKDHALPLLQMARKDLTALRHMLSPDDFPEEIFGFHAQQAIEKALKAWLAAKSLTYPKSHDVSQLVATLHQAGEDLASFPNLEDYTVFAVQYRYEAYDDAGMRSRAAAPSRRRNVFSRTCKK
jgi:HEPN domain-containing protein